MSASQTPRWGPGHWKTIALLFVCYVGYYICRSNLNVCQTSIEAEFTAQGTPITNEEFGSIDSYGVLFYAGGKLVNGFLVDLLGGKSLLCGGMLFSAVMTWWFSMGFGLSFFTGIWCANRFIQSMGWGGLVKIAGQWFHPREYGYVMGILSLSYLFGDAFARYYLSSFLGWGWRDVFRLASGSLLMLGIVGLLFLRSRPVESNSIAAERKKTGGSCPPLAEGPQGGLAHALRKMFSNPWFWVACILNFGLTLIRQAFNSWTPKYFSSLLLLEGYTAEEAQIRGGQLSSMFPLMGGVASLIAGWLTIRNGRNHSRIIIPTTLLLMGVLLVLSQSRNSTSAVWLISISALLLAAPYTMLSGVVALELGGVQAAATAAGVIDAVGYLGSYFSGAYVGRLIDHDKTYAGMFYFLAFWSLLTSLVGTLGFVLERRENRKIH